ncbi:PH domain-containing protein [Propionispora hippei]|uniref:PH domain-containing protein n=1 Tax=Propionispora hippei DSM 15287 TaxID=1123003 RepID=A0A1M6INV9_9FIRM|nr:PH domain-containing protein [Propionispora hippei]SHJ36134.1 PH domain-containing protein [Propionispora hippei DSM 15287]
MIYQFPKSPLDRMACFSTVSSFAILWGITLYVVLYSPLNKGYFWLALVWLAFLSAYFWQVRFYTLREDCVVIHRFIGNIVIPLKKIESVQRVEKLSISLRLFGSGGLFGYFGIFQLEQGGRIRLYCTRSSNLVVIKADKAYAISPNDSAEFCQRVMEKMGKQWTEKEG